MKDIEQFLRDNAPETPDEGQFMIETNARLNAVEGIKRTVDGERRRGRIVLVVTLVAGIVLGSLATLFLSLHPALPKLPDLPILENLPGSPAIWKSLSLGLVACLAIGLGVVLLSKKREDAF